MKYFLILSFILAGCAKNSEISANDVEQQSQQKAARKLAADSQLTVSFDFTQVTANRDDRVHLHVLLSKKMAEPVSVNVSLADATALYQRDYTGFASGNHQVQTVTVEPGSLIAHFPRIVVTKQALCGGKFLVQLSAEKGQSIALGPPAEILINCP